MNYFFILNQFYPDWLEQSKFAFNLLNESFFLWFYIFALSIMLIVMEVKIWNKLYILQTVSYVQRSSHYSSLSDGKE